jgi:hypothetical protein
MIDSETIAPTRPAGTDYAASHRHGHAKQLRHDAALAIVGLPYAMSRASIRACPIPELILALQQSFENGRH